MAVLASAALLVAGLASCTMDEDRRSDTVEVDGREVSTSGFEDGTLIVKLSEGLASRLSLNTDGVVRLDATGVKSVDDAVSSLGIVSMERVFTSDVFEERLRKEGMHLFYEIRYDSDEPLTRAADELSSIEGFDIVELSPKIVRLDGEVVPGSYVSSLLPDQSASMKNNVVRNASASDVFNDPRLNSQWHYYNAGNVANSAAGADINVLPAWEKGMVGNRYTKDNREVIVSVVDGGVNFDHEDLKDNMWTSADGSHGYNFVTDTRNVSSDDHGTHVAGTVAAVNNNGIGVCGVAGGDYENGISGVRIMTCQIFEGKDGCTSTNLARALQYGADNGAVICQNSWGYEKESIQNGLHDTPAAIKTAIDYFTRYAGQDQAGNQVGPMDGGLVIFAAGNDAMNEGYPASYETCLAVAAMAADYEPAYYTNYGDWVDICAPGGDAYKGPQVLSTVPGGYALMQGTSMACPHVSGVAALLVSEYGGPGFTNDQLREMLVSSARDVSAYMNAQYSGAGLVDVGAAINTISFIAPDPIEDFSAQPRSNFIDFTFSVPADEDNGTPATARVYYSTSTIDIEDSVALEELDHVEIDLTSLKLGDKASGSISGLEFGTTYWVTATVSDVARNRSAACEPVQVVTGENHAPEFRPSTPLDTTVKQSQNVTIDMMVIDEDGHSITPSVEAAGASAIMINDSTIRVRIATQTVGGGEHTIEVVASDGYDQSVRVINLSVVPNNPPSVIEGGDQDGDVNLLDGSLVMSDNANSEFDMTKYFSDPDGDDLTYRVQYTEMGIVQGTVANNILTLVPQSQGQTRVTVTALDDMNEAASISFDVLVRDGSKAADFYPNPVVDVLNVRTGVATDNAVLQIRSASGALKVDEKDLSIAPFEPYQIDVSRLAAGMYTVSLSYTDENGMTKSITTDIAKL